MNIIVTLIVPTIAQDNSGALDEVEGLLLEKGLHEYIGKLSVEQ